MKKLFTNFATLLLLSVVALDASAAIEKQNIKRDAEPEPIPAPVLTKAPELIKFSPAAYPKTLIGTGIDGEARLFIDIDIRGRVERSEIISATHPLFAEAALAAAALLIFSPAEVDYAPAAIRIEYRYVFEAQLPEPDAIAGIMPSVSTREAPVNFIGTVREAGVRRPIPGAIIEVGGRKVAETSTTGEFSVQGVAPGAFGVKISAPGYEPYTVNENVQKDERIEVRYYLLKISTNPFETIVRSKKDRREVSKIELGRKELTKIPGTFGDPVRVIENLPGMGRTPGGMGGALLVRGAQPSDSRVYFDGAEIPILYHFGGLTSIVNPSFLEQIDFYPGGFGARYGDAIAGIVEITSRDLDCEMWRGDAEIDVMDSSAFTCLPLGQWKAAVAARRSYIDVLLPSVMDAMPLSEDAATITASPVYWDYQAKASRSFDNHTVDIFAFGSDDKLKLILAGSTEDINLDFGVHIAFHRLMIRDRWAINDHTTLTSTFSPGVQTTGFDQSSEEIGLDANFNLDIWGIDWREDFETKINSWMDFRAGLDLRMGYADLNLEFPFVASLRRFPSQVMDLSQTSKYTDEMKVYNHAYWVETQIEPTEGLKIIPGLRFDRWDFHHTQDYSIQPRLAVRYQLNEEATIKGAYGLFEKLPEPNYLMTNIGNPNLSPIRSQHFIGGLEYAFTPLINLDLQVYYNQRTRLPAPSSDVALQDGDVLPQIWDNGGTGSSYGVEVLLRHLATADGNFYGWLAYTLSRSAEREHSPGATYDVALADGTVDTYAYSDKETELHLSEFDQTHILTLVGQWILPWGLEAGFRFRLVSGNPYTPRDDGRIYYDADTDSYGVDMTDVERNSSRMPTFNQLDLRIDKTWVMDLWKLTAFLEVINAYNAKNVEQYRYSYDYEEKAAITLLPVIPIIGLKGEF